MLEAKRGWLRILEAFIAIMMILSIILVVYSKTVSTPKKTDAIYNFQKGILEEIAETSQLRDEILQNNLEGTKALISSRITPNFDFDVKICEIDQICNLDIYRKEVYSSERVISSTVQRYQPKKLKLFMWPK